MKQYTILELADKKRFPIRVVENDWPGSDVPFKLYGCFFPKEIYVERIIKYNQYSCIQYYNDGILVSRNVANNFKLETLNKEDHMRVVKEYRQSVAQHMHNQLFGSFYIGSDPEIFVTDKEANLIPAFEFLKSKTDKNVTRSSPSDSSRVYWDGFQAEFETKASNCLAFHCDSVQSGLKAVLKAAKERNKDAKLSIQTTFDIDPKQLAEENKEHVAFGCMPSFNVYGLKGLELDGREVPFRSAGGHIHFGIGKKDEKTVKRIVQALDAVLGVACVSMFASFDDQRRRTMYGLPGEYRLPPHGLEYRTLSNAWLAHPLIMHMVFDLSRKALILGEKGHLYHWKGSDKETISVIKNCDVSRARKILELNKDLMIKIINASYKNISMAEVVYNAFLKGIESVIEEPTNLEKNWSLNSQWVTHGGTKYVGSVYGALKNGEKV